MHLSSSHINPKFQNSSKEDMGTRRDQRFIELVTRVSGMKETGQGGSALYVAGAGMHALPHLTGRCYLLNLKRASTIYN
jgi:hypothetical protein